MGKQALTRIKKYVFVTGSYRKPRISIGLVQEFLISGAIESLSIEPQYILKSGFAYLQYLGPDFSRQRGNRTLGLSLRMSGGCNN